MGKGKSLINSLIALQKANIGKSGKSNAPLGEFVNNPTTRQGDLSVFDFSADDIREITENGLEEKSVGIEYQQDQKVGQLIRAIKSANDNTSFYGVSAKQLNDAGSVHQKAFVDMASAKRTADAVRRKEESAKFLNGLAGSWYKTTSGGSYGGSRSIYGKENQADFKKAIEAMGGKAVFNGEVASYSYPLTDEEVYGKAPTGKKARQKWLKEKDLRASANISAIEEKNFGDIFRKADSDRKKAQEGGGSQGNAEAEEKENKRRILTNFSKTLAIVTVLTDIARRILTSVLASATKARGEAIQANALGMTYYQQRGFNQSDRAHGLAEGTTANAVADIQSMFGDVTNLDEKALESLARVMGGSVSEMVRSGMGGQDPAKLLEMIMNKYYESFKQGKNSLGQYVGQEDALRELTTVLNQISPNLAQIFSTMAVQSNTGMYKGRFGNYTEYMQTSMINRGGLTDVELSSFVALGDVINSTKDAFTQISDTLKVKVANSLASFIGKINDMRLGESADQKVEHNKANREKLKKSLAVDEEKLAIDQAVIESALKSEEYKDFANLSVEDISKFAGKDINSFKGADRQKAESVQALLNRASLSSDQNMFAHIGQMLATQDRMEEERKQLAKKSGNIEFNEADYSDEGKALADRNRMLALRQGVSAGGTTYGASGLLSQLEGAKTGWGGEFMDLSKLDPNALNALRATMENYYSEYDHKMFNVGAGGNVSLDESFAGKSWRGNYNDPLLMAMAEQYNKTAEKGQEIDVTGFGGVTEQGYAKIAQILEAGEKAKLRYTNEEGVLDEQAFRNDKAYQAYQQMKNAELAGFASMMTDGGGVGERGDSIRSFRNSAEAMEKQLQEQAESLTKVNSSLLSTGATVEAIRDLVALANSDDSTKAYYYKKYTEGKNQVEVQLVLKDSKGNVIATKKLSNETVTGGSSFSGTTITEIDMAEADKRMNN